MPRRSPFCLLRKRVSRFLGDVSMVTDLTDDSLVAELRRLTGHNLDRTTLVRYRAGDRGAPLELLWLLMSAADQGERVAIGNLLLSQFDLKVTDVQQADHNGSLLRDAVRANATAGRLTEAALDALDDGVLDEAERLNLRTLAGELEQQARAVRASTRTVTR